MFKFLLKPLPEPWGAFGEKLLSILVSVKYHIFIASCIFLWHKLITGAEWATLAGTLAALRQVVTMLSSYRTGKVNELNK